VISAAVATAIELEVAGRMLSPYPDARRPVQPVDGIAISTHGKSTTSGWRPGASQIGVNASRRGRDLVGCSSGGGRSDYFVIACSTTAAFELPAASRYDSGIERDI
jgi:hypothetical protein